MTTAGLIMTSAYLIMTSALIIKHRFPQNQINKVGLKLKLYYIPDLKMLKNKIFFFKIFTEDFFF